MSDLQAAGYTDEYLDELNTILHGPYITAIGAYCMGVVESIIRTATGGNLPTRELLALAADCSSVEEAIRIAEQWLIREGYDAHAR